MPMPFATLIGLKLKRGETGSAESHLVIDSDHLNSAGVVHGAVLYALADTAMGAAVYSTLDAEQSCATLEIKINYFKAVHAPGEIVCRAKIVNRGRTTANIDADIFVGESLMAHANGTFAIFIRRPKTP